MRALGEWLTAVAAVSLLLSLVRLLVQKGPLEDAAAFIGGLVLLAVLLDPLVHIDAAKLTLDTDRYRRAVEQRQRELAASQEAEWKRRIEEMAESYISDKAAALGLAVTVRVTARAGADGVPVPVLAELTGKRSDALSRWLEEVMGLPAERQVWNED